MSTRRADSIDRVDSRHARSSRISLPLFTHSMSRCCLSPRQARIGFAGLLVTLLALIVATNRGTTVLSPTIRASTMDVSLMEVRSALHAPTFTPCTRAEIWERMGAGAGKWNCRSGKWVMLNCSLAPQAAAANIGCSVLKKYDRVVFHGDSIIRQFYQGMLIEISGDKEFGSLQGAENTNHSNQWVIPEGASGVNFNHDWVNPPPAHCRGLSNQFLKTGWAGKREGVGCGQGVKCGNCYLHLANTTGQRKYCDGKLSAWYFWAWNRGCEHVGKCLDAHISHTHAALARGERVLLVTGIGMHDNVNFHRSYTTYLKPLLDNFYDNPMVDIVWHMISAAGAAKPKAFIVAQGNDGIRVFNAKMRAHLTTLYPRVVIFDPFKMSLDAEQHCPATMTSLDGTHAPPLVNLMQGNIFLNGIDAIAGNEARGAFRSTEPMDDARVASFNAECTSEGRHDHAVQVPKERATITEAEIVANEIAMKAKFELLKAREEPSCLPKSGPPLANTARRLSRPIHIAMLADAQVPEFIDTNQCERCTVSVSRDTSAADAVVIPTSRTTSFPVTKKPGQLWVNLCIESRRLCKLLDPEVMQKFEQIDAWSNYSMLSDIPAMYSVPSAQSLQSARPRVSSLSRTRNELASYSSSHCRVPRDAFVAKLMGCVRMFFLRSLSCISLLRHLSLTQRTMLLLRKSLATC